MSLVAGYQPWGWILGSGVLLQDIQATIWSQYQLMGGATLLVILLMGLLGFAISRSIVNPLAEIKRAMQQVAAGDLVISIPVHGKDEMGVVAACTNQGLDAIRHALIEASQGPATWQMPPCGSPPRQRRPIRRSTASGINSPSSPPP